MTANTILSDINEIQCGYFLNGEKWYSSDAKQAYNQRVNQANPEEVADAVGKAKVMAEEFIIWAKKNGYSGNIKNVWWTARPGELAKAQNNPDADSRKNPTDILVQFTSGPANGYLGLQAKATKTNGDIGFKNPGIGTIDKSLNIKLGDFYKKKEQEVIAKFKLSTSAQTRKQQIRSNSGIQVQTTIIGQELLSELRDLLLKQMEKLNNGDLLKYLLNYWMDADLLYPPYVKVTGQGKKAPYKAVVMDPTDNPKLEALRKYQIKLEKVGNEQIGISAGSKKIMKIRFKFESEKLASQVKLSGDPW